MPVESLHAVQPDSSPTSWANPCDLVPTIARAQGFAGVIAALRQGRGATIEGAWGSSAALAIAALACEAPGMVLVVIAHVGDIDEFVEDLKTFVGERPEVFPAWLKPPVVTSDLNDPAAGVADEIAARRLHLVQTWRGAGSSASPKLVVTPIQALVQPVPRADALQTAVKTLNVGQTLKPEDLMAWMSSLGMTRVEVVEVAGEFSSRGGLIDLFPPDAAEPIRLEFFGDQLESIRPFDPATQRSLGKWTEARVVIPPRLDLSRPDLLGHPLDDLPPETWIALVEPQDLREEARLYFGRIDDPRGLYPVEETFKRLSGRPSVVVSTLASGMVGTVCRLKVESVERFSGDLNRLKAELDGFAGGDRILIACHNVGEATRLNELLQDTRAHAENRLDLAIGHIHAGFRLIDAGRLVLGDHELFRRRDDRAAGPRRRYQGRAIDSFLDLNEGDLVVHLNHGIGVYRGLKLIEKPGDQVEEVMVIEFAEGTKLYVSISKVDLVQKYVGGGRANPPLSKIGSSAWEKRKKRVADAVRDLAAELIDLQAQRQARPGIALPAVDSHLMREFAASFPYEETPDQLAAIEAIREDQIQPRPMDRLVCGDVGFGKTEVAMRAAFRAVDAGKQVAVLVPTTVLCEQHTRSFRERMAEYPVVIESINRFRTKKQIRDVLERTAQGKVDILIGTHRIVQKDVRFKDLGLVIIDEEQRFGVEDKEWLKSLRTTVDVLTLSATPIPRTLHMSLLGIRDISNLETPPPGRKAIETRICRFDEAIIRQAIHRELNRNGQVYFVHNRVHDLDAIADRLRGIVPEARIVTAHGQMPGDQLEKAMLAFVRHQADILVATTIIESGLDIPNANTIFINEADRHGLADLHQLRGRVGRSRNRAYAYLLLHESRAVTPEAARRLKAIEEFTELGAGFKIALRDLEIRGAGNILGAEQSGHIEAVGYELYCSLLETAVRELTHQPARKSAHCVVELAWKAYLPTQYVPGPKLKVELYRRLGRIANLRQLNEFRQELIDRFGPAPEPVENLLIMAEVRILAAHWGVERVGVLPDSEEDYLSLSFRLKARHRIEKLAKAHSPGVVRIADETSAYVPLGDRRLPGREVARKALDIFRVPG